MGAERCAACGNYIETTKEEHIKKVDPVPLADHLIPNFLLRRLPIPLQMESRFYCEDHEVNE